MFSTIKRLINSKIMNSNMVENQNDLTPLELLRETIKINYDVNLKAFRYLLEKSPSEIKEIKGCDNKDIIRKLELMLSDLDSLIFPQSSVKVNVFKVDDFSAFSGPSGYIDHVVSIDTKRSLKIFIETYIEFLNGGRSLHAYYNGEIFDPGLNPDQWIDYRPGFSD